jgi:hypothetical protein
MRHFIEADYFEADYIEMTDKNLSYDMQAKIHFSSFKQLFKFNSGKTPIGMQNVSLHYGVQGLLYY